MFIKRKGETIQHFHQLVNGYFYFIYIVDYDLEINRSILQQHTLYDFNYMKIYNDRKQINDYHGLGVRAGLDCNRHVGYVGDDGNVQTVLW